MTGLVLRLRLRGCPQGHARLGGWPEVVPEVG